MEPVVITFPMFASPVVQVLIGIIAAIAAVRAIARFIDTMPFT